MSDLVSIVVIGGIVLLLRKWGNYPEPKPQPAQRSPYPPRPMAHRPRPPFRVIDDYDDDED